MAPRHLARLLPFRPPAPPPPTPPAPGAGAGVVLRFRKPRRVDARRDSAPLARKAA